MTEPKRKRETPSAVLSFSGDPYPITEVDVDVQHFMMRRLLRQPFTHQFDVRHLLDDPARHFENPEALVRIARTFTSCIKDELDEQSYLRPGFFAVASLSDNTTLTVRGFAGIVPLLGSRTPKLANGSLVACGNYRERAAWAETLLSPITHSAAPMSTAVIMEPEWPVLTWTGSRAYVVPNCADLDDIDELPPGHPITRLLP